MFVGVNYDAVLSPSSTFALISLTFASSPPLFMILPISPLSFFAMPRFSSREVWRDLREVFKSEIFSREEGEELRETRCEV